MKKNPGKIILLILFIQTAIFANELATYKLFANKYSAMLKEPILITFKVQQKDTTDHMFFLLTPQNNPDYKIRLLRSTNNETIDNQVQASFTYLLFGLKAKKLTVKFDFTIQTASEQALAQSYIDDHDGGKAIEKTNHKISLNPLTINILQLPKNIDLYGDFTLSSKIDKQIVAPYEDVNILYTLKGKGYKNNKLLLLKNMQNITLFKDIYNKETKLTEDGYKIENIYTYALSSTKNFKIPALSLNAYSFTKHKKYKLHIPSYSIQVKPINTKDILDKKNIPNTKSFLSLQNIEIFFNYLIIFSFGFLTSKLLDKRFQNKYKKHKFEDIKKSKTPKQLILVLLNKYDKQETKNFIDQLEKIMYKQSSQKFNKIKKEILEIFSK